jgi:serine/threonine protein phosphatase PrpC
VQVQVQVQVPSMMQSKRKLSSKSTRTHWCSNNSPQNKYSSFAIKGCFVFAVTIVIYVNFRFAYPAIYHKYGSNGVTTTNDVMKKKRDRIKEFQSLPIFPENPKSLSMKSSIQEWEQWTQEPMIGTYRYSPIATLQLPTADLEPKSKSTTKTYDPKLFAKNVRIKAGANNRVDENPKSSVTFLSNNSVILTRKGHKFNPEDGSRTPNQDRVLILSKEAQEDDTNNNDNSEDWWIGLFDGHGYHGQAVSQYCSLEFARHIHQSWEKDITTTTKTTTKVDTIDTLKRSFLETNRSIPPFIASSGSTGISVLRRDNSLYISNVGDSMAFVASYNKNNNDSIKIIYTTQPHKPDSPKERERIENAGGRVQDSPFEGASARLIIPILGGDNGIDASVGLAMSRSLGDHDGENVGLTAEPDTDVLDLSQFDKNEEYIVVAVTDGLVDFGRLSAEEVALSMSKAFSSSSSSSINNNNSNNNKQQRKQKNKLRRSLSTPTAEAAAAKLILKASQLWIRDPDDAGYRDDISIVAHKLRI